MEKNNNGEFNLLENQINLNEKNETKHTERKKENSIFTPYNKPTYDNPNQTRKKEDKYRDSIFTPYNKPTYDNPNQTRKKEDKYRDSIFTPYNKPTYDNPNQTRKKEDKYRDSIFTPYNKPTYDNPNQTRKKEDKYRDSIFTPYNKPTYDDNIFISNYKKEVPINSIFKSASNEQNITNYNSQIISNDYLQKEDKQQSKQTNTSIDKSNKKSINKSINKTKLKENKMKKTKKIIKKGILSLIILLILSSGIEKIYNKAQIHYQTEQIKIEQVINFQNELKEKDIKIEDINSSKESTEKIMQNIDNFNTEFIKENLFEFYLVTNNDMEIMNKLSQKAYGMSFSKYITELGYFDNIYNDYGNIIERYPNYRKWENAIESILLRKAQNNINQEQTKGVSK